MFTKINKTISIAILTAFISSSINGPSYAQAVDPMPRMPTPGVMVQLSPEFTPALLKGIVIHPENALKFDFIVYKGDKILTNAQKRIEYAKLTKYFLASLAIPDEDQWVNLSPYEKDRIIKDDFGKTEMGRDLLAQDYLLKQITASLIDPENNLGKEFWDRVYAQAREQFKTSNVPVNTFNKVWILPDNALIYEKANIAYVLRNHLKVMLEEDYLALKKNQRQPGDMASAVSPSTLPNEIGLNAKAPQGNHLNAVEATHTLSSQIIRQIILPELEREVNEGKNFAPLRQVYSGMLLAAWYKRALKESLLSKIYADKAKIKGVTYTSSVIARSPKGDEAISNRTTNDIEAIYHQYLQAYKKGVFNFIKEDVDKYTHETIPRKYFSGGTTGFGSSTYSKAVHIITSLNAGQSAVMTAEIRGNKMDLAQVAAEEQSVADKAQKTKNSRPPAARKDAAMSTTIKAMFLYRAGKKGGLRSVPEINGDAPFDFYKLKAMAFSTIPEVQQENLSRQNDYILIPWGQPFQTLAITDDEGESAIQIIKENGGYAQVTSEGEIVPIIQGKEYDEGNGFKFIHQKDGVLVITKTNPTPTDISITFFDVAMTAVPVQSWTAGIGQPFTIVDRQGESKVFSFKKPVISDLYFLEDEKGEFKVFKNSLTIKGPGKTKFKITVSKDSRTILIVNVKPYVPFTVREASGWEGPVIWTAKTGQEFKIIDWQDLAKGFRIMRKNKYSYGILDDTGRYSSFKSGEILAGPGDTEFKVTVSKDSKSILFVNLQPNVPFKVLEASALEPVNIWTVQQGQQITMVDWQGQTMSLSFSGPDIGGVYKINGHGGYSLFRSGETIRGPGDTLYKVTVSQDKQSFLIENVKLEFPLRVVAFDPDWMNFKRGKDSLRSILNGGQETDKEALLALLERIRDVDSLTDFAFDVRAKALQDFGNGSSYYQQLAEVYDGLYRFQKRDVEVKKRAIGDKAQAGHDPLGGIDFNAANLDLQIKRDGKGVPLPIAQQDLDKIKIDGLIPIIIDIIPAQDSPLISQLQIS